MSSIIVALTLISSLVGWQAYTNTNFINDIAGDDSLLFLATNGGVVEIAAGPPPAEVRTFVNTDGLPINRCRCLARDDAGNVWVGTDGGGLAVIQPDSGRVTSYRPNDLSLTIHALAFDSARLLAGTDQGLYVIDTRGTPLDFEDDVIARHSVARVPELLSDRVLSVALLDRVWIGTNLGITSVDRAFLNWQPYRRPLGDSVKAIAQWRDSVIIATEDGIAVLGSAGFRPVLVMPQPVEAYDLAVSGPSIYFATEDGLFQGDSLDSTGFQVILREDVRSIALGEMLWAGCGGADAAGSGLRYLPSGQSWAGFWTNCIVSNEVSDCAVRWSGDMYLCHYGRPISWLKPDGSVQPLYDILPVPLQLRADAKGRVWVAHFAFDGGLTVYNPDDASWQSIQWGGWSSWNIIDAFGIDGDDTKWVFNGGSVIVAVDSAGGQEVFELPGLPAPPGGLYEFAFGSRGRAWLGLTVGLVELNYNGTLHDRSDDSYQVISSGLPSPEVRSVAVDGQDRAWAATPQGAACWDGASFSVYTTGNSGILSNNVYRVRVDASDRVWLLTDEGLSVLDQISGIWTSYTPQNSGVVSNPAGIVGFYSSMDVNDAVGKVLVGTRGGLAVLDFAEPTGGSAEHVRVYPNPFIAGTHAGLVVDSLPDDVSWVEVRTIDGRYVAGMSVERARHRAVWRPGNAASGLYLVIVSTPRGLAIERFALVSE